MIFSSVSPGFNLYLDIDTACNSSCDFCIAPTIGRHRATSFGYGLPVALDFAEEHGGSIQIVGGEPTISSRLPMVMKELHYRNFHRIVLNTNGTFLYSDRISDMSFGRVTHVNISRHHYSQELNQDIMRNKPYISNHILRKAIRNLTNSGFFVRLNCNIIKGYIDSLPEMETFVDWAETLGVTMVSFSQTYPLSLFEHQVPPVPGYTESVQVPLVSLVRDIDRQYRPVEIGELGERIGKIFDSWGTPWNTPMSKENPYGKRRYWKRGDAIFSLKTLAGYSVETGLPLPTEYNSYADPELQDTITFAVLHPDGLLTASWDRRERILFNPAVILPEEVVAYA